MELIKVLLIILSFINKLEVAIGISINFIQQ